MEMIGWWVNARSRRVGGIECISRDGYGMMVDDCVTAAAEPVITSSVGRGLSGPCP